jgi:hypothetical protein
VGKPLSQRRRGGRIPQPLIHGRCLLGHSPGPQSIDQDSNTVIPRRWIVNSLQLYTHRVLTGCWTQPTFASSIGTGACKKRLSF